jgi:hypothetical protein
LAVLRLQLGRQRHQFFFGDYPVLVGVSSIEQSMQPHVRHFVLGQLPVLVLVERHHPRDDRGIAEVFRFWLCRIFRGFAAWPLRGRLGQDDPGANHYQHESNELPHRSGPQNPSNHLRQRQFAEPRGFANRRFTCIIPGELRRRPQA